MSEILGTKKEHFTPGTTWVRAFLADDENAEVHEGESGAVKVRFQTITVVSVGAVWATTVALKGHKSRVAPHYLVTRDYRSTLKDAVAALRASKEAEVRSAKRALDNAQASLTVVSAWKEKP